MISKITRAQARRWFPRRSKQAHKGQLGRIYILAGSRGMVGAGVLTSLGAARMGAGLVRLATVRSQQVVAAKRAPLEVMTEALPESAAGYLASAALPKIKKGIKKFKANILAMGPGLGRTASVGKLIRTVVQKTALPMVLDADALHVFKDGDSIFKKRSSATIVTPHEGELAHLLRCPVSKVKKDRLGCAKAFAKKNRLICLLKGPQTLITNGREVWQNTTGNPGMASGGMGDLLTGMIAGVWGQMENQNFKTALEAASLGAFVHGGAADMGARQLTEPVLLSSDVAHYLAAMIQKIGGGRLK